MCGRYYVDADEEDIHSLIMEAQKNGGAVAAGEVFPTNTAAVLAPGGQLTAMHWGFPRYDGKGEIINARSETAGEKAMFRAPFRSGRCLIPASWYFEWEKRGAKKIKYALMPPGQPVTWLAGLSAQDAGTGQLSFVILTRPVWEGIAFIHDRMPVILPTALHDEWLHGHTPESVMARSTQEVSYKLA